MRRLPLTLSLPSRYSVASPSSSSYIPYFSHIASGARILRRLPSTLVRVGGRRLLLRGSTLGIQHPQQRQQRQQRARFLVAPRPLYPANESPSSSASSSLRDALPGATAEGGDEGLGSGSVVGGEGERQGDPYKPSKFPKLPFRFDTGIALFAKRAPRPFPPPFLSPPSGSFSDPLSTHDRSRDRRAAYVDGKLIQGYTNGDDAVFASDYFICANDGVGAWSMRPRGHAGLWARLILHYWATAIFEEAVGQGDDYHPDPRGCLQRAYEQTLEATTAPNDWQGTTTAAGALLHYRHREGQGGGQEQGDIEPLLYVTNVGDSQVMVVRPSTRKLVFKSTEQWHWFDCPRQLGTNSPDTPANCAVVDEVAICEGDIVLAMSDGVIDNLWSHEIVEKVSESLERWQAAQSKNRRAGGTGGADSAMGFVAHELMEAAREIATDPFAESPFMEHAIEEGLASGGGKMDDISVVAALCRKTNT